MIPAAIVGGKRRVREVKDAPTMTLSLEWGNEMIQYFYTKNNRTMEITDTCHDCWIKLTNPTMEEAQMIAEKMHVEVDDLMAAIDLEEKTRIELPEEYTSIVEGTRQMMSTVFDNRLNNVMKILTSITLILAIPTVISGMYGMNVLTKYMPFADTPHGFAIISGIVVMVCIGLLIILKRKRML